MILDGGFEGDGRESKFWAAGTVVEEMSGSKIRPHAY